MSEALEGERLSLAPGSRIWLTVAGLIQGLGFYLLVEFGEDNWKSSGDRLFACGVFLATAAPLFQLTFGIGRLRGVLLASLVAPAILALLWLWSDARLNFTEDGSIDSSQAWWFVLSVGLAIHILLAFTQTFFEESRFRFPYPSLFRFSWNNTLVVLASLAFLGAFWAVLGLWGALFKLVKIDFFVDLFTEPVFAWVFTGMVFGLGIALVRENARILLGLRRIVLVLFRILSPVIAVVGLLFLVVLPFTGLEPLWATSSATPILIGLTFCSVVFVNAVIQDGDTAAHFPTPINWVLAAHLVTLPIFAALAYYSLSLRIDQYGLTPGRFAALLIVLLAGLQVLAYAVAVLRSPRNWAGLATRANPGMALIIAAAALLIHTPLLDPYSRSAASQLERLVQGTADVKTFDFGLLRFELGAPGRAALEEIGALAVEHPQGGAISEQLAGLASVENHWQWKNEWLGRDIEAAERSELIKAFLLYPREFEVPKRIADLILDYRSSYVEQCARDEVECAILSLDIDSDGRGEFVFVSSQASSVPLLMFRHPESEEWMPANRSKVSGAEEFDFEAAIEAIESGDYGLVEPVYPDIRLGKQRLRF